MTFEELIKIGGLKVGNLIVFEGGQSALIGDATVFHSPSINNAGHGWDGWLGKTVLYVFDLLDPRSCAILEQYKMRASIDAAPPKEETDVSQVTPQG
jgi:hypothetical protein